MNPHVNAVAGRLSLRPPQRESLEMLDRIMSKAPGVPPMPGDELPPGSRSPLPE